MRLLLVQTNALQAQATAAAFRSSGAVADQVGTAGEMFDFMQTYDYDIVVLDQELPDLDGVDAIRRLRAQRFTTPVLLLTASVDGRVNAVALRAGADDLLIKPYHGDELVARIESVVRRRNGYTRSVLKVGALAIDMASREVRVDGQPLAVTRKEFAILELMALRRGRVITKQNFLDHLYNGLDGPETRVIDVFICNLRKKLAQLGLGALIDTVRGHGYILRDLPDIAAEVVTLRGMPVKGMPVKGMPVGVMPVDVMQVA